MSLMSETQRGTQRALFHELSKLEVALVENTMAYLPHHHSFCVPEECLPDLRQSREIAAPAIQMSLPVPLNT